MNLKKIIKEEFDAAQDSLIKKWAENEHKMNIMRYENLSPNYVFPNDQFNKLEKSNNDIEDKLYYDDQGFAGDEWIEIAMKYLRELNNEYGLKNPGYNAWAEEQDKNNFFSIDEEKIKERNQHKKFKPKKKKKASKLKHNSSNRIEKSTPRNWSNTYWMDNSIADAIDEVVEPKNVDVDVVKMHNILNNDIWESDELKPEIRRALLKNALLFLEFVGITGIKIYDIVLTGSMANYNYTKDSDIDLHIIVDFNKVDKNVDIVRELFKEKKDNWGLTKDIKINGYDVETYLQDINEPNTMGSGIYSVYKNEWIEKPNRKILSIDKEALQVKAADIMNAIDSLESIQNSDAGLAKLKKIKERIVKLRKTGLQKEGEFSLENLVFKILRHNGYIDKLNDFKKKFFEKSLSVNNNKETKI